MFTSNERMIAG